MRLVAAPVIGALAVLVGLASPLVPVAGGDPVPLVGVTAIEIGADAVTELALAGGAPARIAPLQRHRVPEAQRRGWLIPALFEGLERRPDSARPHLVLRVHPDTPYETIGQVVYTAGQARFDEVHFLVQGAGERRVLTTRLPELGPVPPDHPTDCGAFCWQASLFLQGDEAAIWIRRGSDHAGAVEVRRDHATPHLSSSALAAMLNTKEGIFAELSDGPTPTIGPIPRAPASQPPSAAPPPPPIMPDDWCARVPVSGPALARHLVTARRLDGACETAYVSAALDTPWRSLAPALAALMAAPSRAILTVTDAAPACATPRWGGPTP